MWKMKQRVTNFQPLGILTAKKIESEINHFFSGAPSYNSTYKLYLFKTLLDLKDYGNFTNPNDRSWVTNAIGNAVSVDLNFLSTRFVYHYWNLWFKFKLRQSPNPDPLKGVVIYGLLDAIKAKRTDEKRPNIEELSDSSLNDLRKEVIKCIRRQALWKLQNDCMIYEIVDSKTILVPMGVIEYFKGEYYVLTSALNFQIAKFLERINQAPKIAEKVVGVLQRTSLPDLEFDKIKRDQGFKCFYCSAKTIDAQEHVIPWNYLYDTKPFNIVGACQSCNSAKNDSAPNKAFFDQVIVRNHRLYSNYIGYNEQLYTNIYSACIQEYNKKTWP